MTDETYVPLSRGLLDHMANMSPVETKVYITLLMMASPFDRGTGKGCVSVSLRDIGDCVRIQPVRVGAAIKALVDGKYIEVVSVGKNQWQSSIYRISKYKTVGDFAVRENGTATVTALDTAEDTATDTACIQQGYSMYTADAGNASIDAPLQPPNKEKKEEKDNTGNKLPGDPPGDNPPDGDKQRKLSPQTTLFEYYVDCWQERYCTDRPERPPGGKGDFVQLAGLIKKYGLDRCLQMVDAYFELTDKFYQGHPIGNFHTANTVTKILARLSGRSAGGGSSGLTGAASVDAAVERMEAGYDGK
ncbi:MAG: hypothetical protein PHT33_10780 [bacterium]|nr:hypothetical protein [bacterium]